MVSGVVVPPRLDLANEELVKSHVHAVWLGWVGLDLKDSIAEILDINQEDYPVLESISNQIKLSDSKLKACLGDCRAIMEQCEQDLAAAGWYSDQWLESVVRSSAKEFDNSFERWREMYKSANEQLVKSQEIVRTAHQKGLTKQEEEEADRLAQEARHQRDLLCNRVKSKDDSDFYPYRYLAAEGFLPGYNFPRLPVRAYIYRGDKKGIFLARPRFLAISEFGPRNIIYHEGRKYRVVRSLMPSSDPESRFLRAKLCKSCGTFHTGDDLSADICQQCGTGLDADNSEFLPGLFEMTSVATQSADRISCDEEERLRQGYDITTHFRFSQEDGKYRRSSAEVLSSENETLLTLTYGPSAHMWRINRRWRRSSATGFSLNMELGIWKTKQGDYEDTALDSGTTSVKSGVQILVRDTRNILVVKPSADNPLTEEQIANLQHVLQKSLCAVFQVDESEVATERLGLGENRSILFWEAAEGGVGVLLRLVDEPDAISRMALKALEICHFDPVTGDESDQNTECAPCLL